MTGGSYRIGCDDCGAEIRASAEYCPNCGERQSWFSDDENEDDTEGNLEEVFRRETITEAGDGGLLVGEREFVDRVDDVCSELEALREGADDPRVKEELQTAVGAVWRASVLQRVAENDDIRMAADTGPEATPVRGSVPTGFTRDGGGEDV
ncbi:zinc ribbon domain-containing protein [Natrinema thermotolerans]|uniref:Zinc ribbon domain-containing protein n=1 Tax=Natrinema thermotolerans TaxID=121872 RepID=A0AAF0T6F1_9EURY|nr:zinc ribbon domain-containing protein [Natrinema thermotolerans]WPH65881.1 zinc ribbon domain-containing protein [Haloarchaeal virus HJTV-4]QCC60785.1 zinc ribbon domain-containing protein [Natrinema thermotolerans]QCC61664.1 zinc ribbon domain-containing protein [Natrinema thermotolerans]WMT07832.1 zinc ribbon domain-containing protein [Natrinema thermotolerans]WMT08464.1 zinc ribbon domain-containing protein [Natrinema thermotolerans]